MTNIKYASLLLGLLTLPLLFNFAPLEILRLKTFDALVQTPEPSGHFTILNITEEDVQLKGGYPFPRQDLASIHLELQCQCKFYFLRHILRFLNNFCLSPFYLEMLPC